MERVWIRGTTGSGKTTLGLEVARRLACPAVDLDDLNWLPGWTERPEEEFQSLASQAAAAPRWTIAGNYGKAREFLEPRADTVVWLDYSFPVVFSRLLRRTLRRCLRGEACCNGNRESIRKAFFVRESILWWCVTTHARRHREALAFVAAPAPEGQTRLRHRTPRETRDWLAALP